LEIVDVSEGVSKRVAVSALGGGGTTPTLAEVLAEGATNNQIPLELDCDEAELIMFSSNGDNIGGIFGTSQGIYIVTNDPLGENSTFYNNGSIDVQKDAGSPINLLLPYTDETTGNTIATREWVEDNVSGGAVDSVNGQTGVVVLDAGDVGAEPTITATTSADYYRGDKTFQPAIDLPINTATQTALDDRARTAVNCNVLGTPTALSSAPGVVIYQKTFSANEFSDLDTFEIESINEKTETTATSSIRIYVDTATTFDIATAQLLATSPNLAASNLFLALKREFTVRGSTLKGFINTIGRQTDESLSELAANRFTSSTFDPTVSQTFYVVVTGNVSDTVTKQNFKITVMQNKS
jgi:hypothetical protein